MALAISVGFVVDDAIVVIENVVHKIEDGARPLEAAIDGAGQIAFTVLTISLSLVAAFLPLMLMGGAIGRYFKEFSLTVAFAIGVSTVVALTLTPMLCGQYLRMRPERRQRRSLMSRITAATVRVYEASLRVALRQSWLLIIALLMTIYFTWQLLVILPKGYF